MEPIEATPTRPVDYALISGTYASLLTGLAVSSRGREPVSNTDLVPLGLASFALAKLLVHEKVETWLREPFVEERPDGRRPRGRGMRYAVGELLSCTRCAGAWSALALVGLRVHAPHVSRTVASVMAVSALNDFGQAGFAWLRSRSSVEQERVSEEAARAEGEEARTAQARDGSRSRSQPSESPRAA